MIWTSSTSSVFSLVFILGFLRGLGFRFCFVIGGDGDPTTCDALPTAAGILDPAAVAAGRASSADHVLELVPHQSGH